MACLDALMAAFNAHDLAAFEATFNVASVRLASNTPRIINRSDHQPSMFDTGPLSDWNHSAWERRQVIHGGPDTVHLDTCFTR